MCWMCDDAGVTMEDYHQLIRDKIREFGWSIQGVERDRRRPPFAYTVGLTERGLAELLVTGLPMRDAADLLNSVTTHMICHGGGPLTAGEQVPLRGGPTFEVVDLASPDVHLVMAVGLYGPGIAGQQLVYADDRGHWPWDTGFRGNQPVLGPRAAL